MDQAKNGARATLASGITAAATSVSLTTGHGARMPAVPFNAWIYNSTDYASDPHDDPGYEIVRVTNRSSDTLTVTRAQEATGASDHNTSGKTYRLVAGQTAKVINTDLPTFFTRYRTREYDARNYLAGDGVTDDTAALQAIFTAIDTDSENATIYFDNATYLIAGALQDGSRRNAQLLLPTVAINEQQYTVQLIGHSVPACSPSGYEPIVLPRGTRIKSTLAAGSGSDPSVISGRGPSGGYLDEVNYLHIEFENIVFETIPNPTYSCVNLRRFTSVAVTNCVIAAGPYMDVVRATQPTSTGSYGLILPQFNCGICQRLEGQVNVFGFYIGVRCGELMHAENLGVWWCQRGLEFPFSYHASLIDRLLVFWCPYGAVWMDDHPVEIQQWDNEHTLAGESRWFATIADVSDPANHAYGEIKWLSVRASFGRESVFTVLGGMHLITRELGVADVPETAAGLFNDMFSDPDGTLITAHSPDIGTGWTRFEGAGANQASIVSNCLTGYFDSGNAYSYYADDTQANVIITADAIFPIGATPGTAYCELIFRFTDPSNHWILRWCNLGANNFQIVKREAAAETALQTATRAFTAGTASILTVTLSGTSIQCDVDGTTLSTTSSFNSTAVKHGVRMFRGTALVTCMDNFRIEAN